MQNSWIGLGDQSREGIYRLVNGDRVASTDPNLWYPGEPNGGILTIVATDISFGLIRMPTIQEAQECASRNV